MPTDWNKIKDEAEAEYAKAETSAEKFTTGHVMLAVIATFVVAFVLGALLF